MLDWYERLEAWSQNIRNSFNDPPRLRPILAGPDYDQRTEYFWLDKPVGSCSWKKGRCTVIANARNAEGVKMAEVRNETEAEAWLMENVPVCRRYRLACGAVDKVIRRHHE